jgi:class 3 adenylate cyclase
MEPRIQYAKTSDGASIACAVIGNGRPLVLVPQLWGDLAMYASGPGRLRSFIDPLAEAGHQVIAFDPRGSGSSDRQMSDYSPEGRMKDLEAVVERVGHAEFDLLARPHAVATAVAYANRFPERITKLVLHNPYARGADYYQSSPYTRAIYRFADMADDDWEFFTLTLANWAGKFQDPEFARELAAAFKDNLTGEGYVQAVTEIHLVAIREQLRKVSVPTLVVRDASAGVFAIPELANEVAALVPNAESVAVDSREALTRVIHEFLSTEAADGTASPTAGSGLAVVLFTDIVGHTEMMSRLGDERGREVLRDHERITRQALSDHGGDEVKTMGDGFMASFSSVTKALECAISLQRAFAERESEEPLTVRIGINAGEPIEEDGDLFGATVILASRIASKAEGSEILVADTVRGLCSGKGFLFADRGEFVAKGFEDPVRLYEVRWRGAD